MGYIAIYFTFLLALSATFNLTHAQEYSITNTAPTTPGGSKYNNEIGDQYTYNALGSASNFIFGIFQQPNVEDRKNVQQVNFFIDDMDGVAYTINNEIHYSARYINDYQGDLKREFSGVVYHEMTHVWQWNGNGQVPGGLIEGIADFVRLRAGYAPSHWVQPGEGDKWDQGYDVTARFLDYCNGLRNGFVAELNGQMRNGYSDQYFFDLLGKSVDQLWNDYKANYAK